MLVNMLVNNSVLRNSFNAEPKISPVPQIDLPNYHEFRLHCPFHEIEVKLSIIMNNKLITTKRRKLCSQRSLL